MVAHILHSIKKSIITVSAANNFFSKSNSNQLKKLQKERSFEKSMSYLDWDYHLSNRRTALGLLKRIESVKGKIDNQLIKLSDEYALDVLGWKGFAPWLYVYSAVNQEFKEGWIPANYFGKIVVPQLKGNYGTIADCNSLTSRLFKSSLFPDYVYYTNEVWFSREYKVLKKSEVTEMINKVSENFIYKIDNSVQGKGVHIVENNKFDIEKLQILGNGVLQKYINQHSFFKSMMPNSVATLRVTSVIDDNGIVSIRACFLRLGRSSDTHVKSASHIRIPVNLTTGKLEKHGYSTNFIQIESHPDTNFVFENKQIPNFNDCISAAQTLHKMVPFTRSVGWDMIIDSNNNVQVMEWNGSHHDIKFGEVTQGPCFSDLGWDRLPKQ